MPAPEFIALVYPARWLVLLIVVMLIACGTPSTTSGNAIGPAATAIPTATSTGKSNIVVPVGAPASASPGSSSGPAASNVPALPSTNPSPSAIAFPSPSAAPAPSTAGTDPAPSPPPGSGPLLSPSVAPQTVPASAAPVPSVAPQQSPSQIPAQDGKCPGAYEWAAYIGPTGQKWYRNPHS